MAVSLLRQYLSNTPLEEQSSATLAYLASIDHLSDQAPSIARSIAKELEDQRSHLKLIASENYSSPAVQLAMGNWLTDKYSEGYPFHRFYAGCDNVDQIEAEAVSTAKALFGADHAYVQPHSGADANLVAFWAALTTRFQLPELERLGVKNVDALSEEDYEKLRQTLINQKLMGMSLNAGGHLTHGYRHNLSSKFFRPVSYDVDPKTEQIDYTRLAEQVLAEKPAILMAGYSAYPRCLNFARLREIADSVGAIFIVDMAHFAGLVAGKALTGDLDPVPHADIVTSTTHKTLRGPRGGIVLCKEEFAEQVDKGCPMVLGGPLPHVMAAKAIAFKEASQASFRTYAAQIIRNAQAMAASFARSGVRLTTGGSENHLLILDVTSFGITGRQAELALTSAGLTVNRNAIPYDKNGPWYTSGVRIGTPAVSSLGMREEQMDQIAEIIVDVLTHTTPTIVERTQKPSKAKYILSEGCLERSRAKVQELLGAFPLYPELPSLRSLLDEQPASRPVGAS